MKSNYNFFKIAFLLMVIWSCEKQGEHDNHSVPLRDSATKMLYTCPMPEDSFFSDKPGNCPKCGMELEPVPQKKKTDTLALLTQPTNSFVVSQLKPIAPSKNKGIKRIAAEGYITYNPNNAIIISAQVEGRIDKLYVRYNFQRVNKGDKLLEMYSPELQTAQNEWLYIVGSKDSSDNNAKEAIQARLFHLGMSLQDIQRLRQSGKVNPLVPIYANATGHVHFLNGNTDISSHAFGLPGSSNKMASNAMSDEEEQVLREGDYVKRGDLLFTIVNQSTVWALFKIMPADISSIQKGERVEFTSNGSTHEGTVDFVENSFEPGTDFYTIRVHLECDDHNSLKIGSLVNGYITTKKAKSETIWVPSLAVLALGKAKSAVFVKKDLGYQAKAITTGASTSEWTEVTGGLAATDSIAPIASYLIDSEGFIITQE